MCFLISIFLCFALVPKLVARTVDFHRYWYRILKCWYRDNTNIYIYIYYILRKGPAHIIQRPTGKTPGAPDGQSATGLIPGAVLGVSGYPGLSPETLIYVSENTGYKSNKTGYAEKLHWLMPSSHCMIFKVIGSALFSHCTTIWGSSQSLLCSHCTIDRRQEVTHCMTLQ